MIKVEGGRIGRMKERKAQRKNKNCEGRRIESIKLEE